MSIIECEAVFSGYYVDGSLRIPLSSVPLIDRKLAIPYVNFCHEMWQLLRIRMMYFSIIIFFETEDATNESSLFFGIR